MKKLIALLLALAISASLCACGAPAKEEPAAAEESAASAKTPTEESPAAATENDNPIWGKLESLGKIETENGVAYVTLTLPAELTDPETTQEQIDAEAGEFYTSGKLNDDGSVTYKMTKEQHKAMLKKVTDSIDEGLQELISTAELSITKVTHNDSFTSFDVQLSKDEVGMMESVAVIGLYLYGGMYAVFSGQDAEDIAVNFYGANGSLLKTAKKSDMESGLGAAIGSIFGG